MLRWFYLWCDGIRHQRRLRNTNPEHALGRRGEDLAHRHLQKKGYSVVARNHTTPGRNAEVDIVALDGDTVVFVEVKTRMTADFGSPERAIDETKRRKIVSGAEHYLRQHSEHTKAITRFDVVTVVLKPMLVIEHLADAFRPARFG